LHEHGIWYNIIIGTIIAPETREEMNKNKRERAIIAKRFFFFFFIEPFVGQFPLLVFLLCQNTVHIDDLPR